MSTAARLALFVALLAGVAIPVACRVDDPTCYEGDFVACTCSNGRAGYQGCLPAQERYGTCVCDGTTPGLDGSFDEDAGDARADGGKLPFMSRCETNEQCETGNCHLFSMQGSFCTQTCKVVTDCPAPSTGCNNRGICKAP
jgi:hypothetical protein